jgi:hypothetical protein
MAVQFKIEGTITQSETQSDRSLLSSITVRAFDKGLPSLGARGEQQLGTDALTDAEGRYAITFTEEDFSRGKSLRRGKVRPDLFIRVFDGDTLLGESNIHFHAEPETRIDLTVEVPERSEYEALVHRLTPILQGIAIADLTDEDLAFIEGETGVGESWLTRLGTFLHGATDVARNRIRLLRQSAQYAQRTQLLAEAFYGWGRMLGASLTPDQLSQSTDADLRRSLVEAIEKKIIPTALRGQIEAIIRGVKQIGFVPYQATVQLLDQDSGQPLPGFRVRVIEVEPSTSPQDMGSSTTNGKGLFTFSYTAPPAQSGQGAAPQFLLKVTGSKGQELADTPLHLEAGHSEVIPVQLHVPLPQVPPSPSVHEVISTLGVDAPQALRSLLSDHNIQTLADIRNTGGLAHRTDLPLEADHRALQMLEAHADLSRVSADIHVNTSLIAKGYTSVAAIADTPRATFVAATHETLGDFKAARLHAVARAQTAFLDNILTGMATAQKTVAGADGTGEGLALLPQRCTCEDCESAISPALYLADLLKYATDHVQRDGQNVNLQFLVDTFHQPFDALPVSCEAVEQPVRIARMCIEILRAHLGPRPLNDSQKENALQKIELEYLTNAYTLLLHQIGTSYDEIRLARTDTTDNRLALAERLGIALTSPRPAAGDELDRMFLEFPDAAGSPATLDQLRNLERQLEGLFGLVDTGRDPLSDGAKFGDDPNSPSIARWNLRGVEWGRNTDQDGNIYVTESLEAFFSITLYKDQQRSQRVASGNRPTTFGPIELQPQDFSNLSGVFSIVSFETLGNIIVLSAIPNFLSWRLKHLRATWSQQDYPADPYATGALPLIDPDLIGPDDFRSPVPKASAGGPNITAFDLWLTRRGVIDTMLSTLQRDREANTDGLTFILKEVFGNPLPDFDALLQELTQGDKDTVKAATEAVSNLNLNVDSFTRLMEIRSKDAQSRGGPGDPVSPAEWGEVYAILTQVRKVRLFNPWRAAEQQLNIVLGMRDFWISLREPVEGDWPPAQLVSGAQTPTTPLIDPDLQTLQDLPEPVAGAQAITFWTDRAAQLKTTNATLASTRQNSGFEAMLKFALGDPLPHDLDRLRQDLASRNPATVNAAQNAITNDLHLTLDGFTRLMAIRDKDAQADLGKKPTATEYAEVATLLTKAWKSRVAYLQWINDENNAFTAEGQTAGDPFIAYWRARKATLPRWRASSEARQVWQRTLKARSAPPIIDPDIIDAYDFRDLIPAPKTAYGIWQERSKEITGRISTITTTPPRTKGDLDTLFQNQDYLSFKADGLFVLDQDRSVGHSIQGRLDQLGLSNAAFDTLLRVSQLVENGQSLLPAEWLDVASILVQSFKTKQFAAWRLEEQDSAMVLALDFFQVRPSSTDPLFPIPAPTLPAWRATIADRRAWQDTLQSRIDEQNSTIDGMRQAVSATEAANLQVLRDGLVIAAAAAGGSDLDRAADWVTKRFLIDAKVDASQTTTRVEQAIETLQSLLLSLAEEPFDLSRFELAGSVAAVKASDGIHLFARGADDVLWHTREVGNDWQEWESLGDVINSDPAVCIHNSKLEFFALRYDNAVWRKTFDNGLWSDWESLGGVGSSAPAAVSWGGDHLEVVVRGTDWHIYHNRFENGQWAGWQDLGGILSSGPTIASPGIQKLHVLARGLDNAIWHLAYDNGWKTWNSLGGIFDSAPAAVASPKLSTTIYLRGTDDLLYSGFIIPGFPTRWSSYPGFLLTSSPAACIIDSLAFLDVEGVFVRGHDYRVYERFRGEWTPIGPAPLTLQDPNFEETWKWLGSYAKWRAAMLVFLYPENLLLPTLRPASWQTSGFWALANALTTAGTLIPDTACRAAKQYAEYFEDVCTLSVEATCQTGTITYVGDACQGSLNPELHYLFYMFARGGKTNRLYWSVYNPDAEHDYAQSAWIEVGGSDEGAPPAGNLTEVFKGVSRLIGAAPFVTVSGKKVICLFVSASVNGNAKLYLLRFFVDSQQWDSSAIDLSPAGSGYAPILLQSDQENSSPALIIQYPNGTVFFGKLNGDATEWSAGFPLQVNIANPIAPSILTAITPTGTVSSNTRFGTIISGLLFSEVTSGKWQSNSFYETPPQIVGKNGGVDGVLYHGSAWLPYSTTMPVFLHPSGKGYEVIVFWGLNVAGSEVSQQSTDFAGNGDPTNTGISEIGDIVPNSGFVPNPDGNDFNAAPRQFVYRVRDANSILFGPALRIQALQGLPTDGAPIVPRVPPPIPSPNFLFAQKFRRCTFGWNQTAFFLQSDGPLEPDVQDGPFDIPGELSSTALQARRLQIEQVFLQNLSYPSSLLTYLEEAYYFVPMQLALQLQRSGEYETALGWFRTVYDYTAPKGDERKIYYGLKEEESIQNNYKRPDNWLSNPLNPHAIAQTRGNTYTRFTLLAIIRCLLDYADSEFSQNTGESVARARNLYQTALDLLDTDELKQNTGDCAILSGALNANLDESIANGALLTRLKMRLNNIAERDRLRDTVVRMQDILKGDGPPEQRFAKADRLAMQAEAEPSRAVMQEVLSQSQDRRRQLYSSVTRTRSIAEAVQAVGESAGSDFTNVVATVTNLSMEQLEGEKIELPWLRVTSKSDSGAMGDAGAAPRVLLQTHQSFQLGFVPSAASLWGCIPPNPALASLRQHAEVNLSKLRSGRNIAGMKRELDPYAAPTNTTSGLPTIGAGGQLNLPGIVSIQPTLYRYTVLIERAKQLTQAASQMEVQMLNALEKFDDKSYGLLLARQQLDVTQSTLKLQDLRKTEASDHINLAKQQRAKIDNEISHFQGLLQAGTSKAEKDALDNLDQASQISEYLSKHSVVQGFSVGFSFPPSFGINIASASGETPFDASAASIDASKAQLLASFERREQEWQYQLLLASDDAQIGDEQITLANDAFNIAEQEQRIAELQHSNAKDAVEFLMNEFTSPDLFNWMSGVLQNVYSYFLRQATAMAKLAENQVAFERQEVPTAFIQADYWAPPADLRFAGGSTGPDRKGLTGAERLLQDITQLDQYAFLTDTRKLQLVKTFSLGRLAPAEFQRFRESGVMTFTTPMELFDRDFPGHYLRLISRVRTTVIALIPPNQGISATLSSSGLSRVAIGGDVFQTVPIRRRPESVALSSPVSATGVSELTPQSNTMLLPFEDMGVDTAWEFRMEKAANLFDYSTIADVLVTIEYTALSSLNYRQQVIQSLSSTVSADRPYSFRNQFSDQWYDLHNPEQSSTPMTVQFKTFPGDFPPNIDDVRIQQILLYFSRADGQEFAVPVTSLRFTSQGNVGSVGGGATSIDGIISTRRGNAGSWTAMIGKAPFGDWELVLPKTDEMKNRFNNEEITDILFVITYSGRTPEWQS